MFPGAQWAKGPGRVEVFPKMEAQGKCAKRGHVPLLAGLSLHCLGALFSLIDAGSGFTACKVSLSFSFTVQNEEGG
eukprot:1161163-Pelagomonas_calceolata.AAC.13